MLHASRSSAGQSRTSKSKSKQRRAEPPAKRGPASYALSTASSSVAVRHALENAAHTTRHGPVRSTGNVIEDIFFTYTGCASIDAFLDLQEAGTALAESVVQGSAFTHEAVQPHVPSLLKAWLAHTVKTSAPAMNTGDASAVKNSGELKTATTAAATKKSASHAVSSYRHVPKAPTTLPRLAASVTGTGDDGDAEGQLSTPLLPALEELPAITRCDEAAVLTLRTRVDAYLRRLVHLVQLTYALQERWGLLSESERLTLHNAMTGLTQNRLSRQDIMNVFETFNFCDENLEDVSAEIDDCQHAEVVVVSDNAKLSTIEHIPPHAHTLWASACAITQLNFAALTFTPHLSVLGLPFNRLRDIHFISQLPSLRILDVSHNELASVDSVTGDVRVHAALEDISLLGNPVALLEGYRRLVGSQCTNLRTLDGFVLQSRERVAFTLEDYTKYELYAHPPPPLPTTKKGGGVDTGNNSARRKGPQQPARVGAGRSRSSHPVDAAAAAAPDHEDPAAAAGSQTHTDLQDEYEQSVEATLSILQVSGLATVMPEPLTIASEEELQPFSALVLEAAGLTRVDSDDHAWRLPPSWRAQVPALERVLATLPDGGPAMTAHATTATVDALTSARTPHRRVDGADASDDGATGPTSPLPVGGGKKTQAGKAPQRIPLYEAASVLRVSGAWGAAQPSSPPAEACVGIDVCVFDSAEYQFDSSVGTGLALFHASLPTAEGAAMDTALAATASKSPKPAGALTPPPTQQGARQGTVSKLRRAVAATVVEDTAALNQSATGDLPLTPRLAARLRQPIQLAVTVEDAVLVWNSEARKALLEGGGPSSHKALQKAVQCSLASSSSPAATTTTAMASHRGAASGSTAAPSPRGGLTSRHNSASHRVTEKVDLAHISATSSTTVPSSVGSTVPPLPPVKPVLQTRAYRIGYFTVDPDALLSQNMHLRPPRATPVAPSTTKSSSISGNAGGGASSKKAPRPVLEGTAAELPCARELFLRGVSLEHSAADEEVLRRDVAVAQAELCACLESYAAAYEQVVMRRKELTTMAAGSSTSAPPGTAAAHSPSISLAGTMHSNSVLLSSAAGGAAASAASTSHSRARHGGGAAGGVGGGSANSGRRQSVKPPSAEALTLLQWEKALEPWRAAVVDCAVHVLATKTRATEVSRIRLQLDVQLKLGRGPAPPLPPDEETRQAPAPTREKSNKNR